MARKVILTCDECKSDIKVYHTSKALAMEHKQFNNSAPVPKFLKLSLGFEQWDDERALLDGMLHFCTDTCATRRLDSWLLEQRMKVEKVEPPVIDAEYAEVEPAAPVQESDSEEKGCTCFQKGNTFAAPEMHSPSCPESLVRRRAAEEARKAKEQGIPF